MSVTVKVLALIFLVWIIQIIFLSQAAKTGLNGWDDWGMVVTYDAFNGNDLRNFPSLARFYGSPYLWSESYNIGIIKNIFGLDQPTLRLLEILAKALAALSAGYMVFKFTKNKLFFFFAVFFFITFSSTAGPLNRIIFIGAYLTISFACFSVISYVKSFKKQRWILLSSFFFFLALVVCPSRAYLIVPVPLLVELAFLMRSRQVSIFLKRIVIFYFPLVVFQAWLFLNGDRPHPAFMPQLDILSRVQQLTSGNFYTLSLPFQALSNLFIDTSFIREILKVSGQSLLLGFILINLILLILAVPLTLAIWGKKFISQTIRLIKITIIFELIFYLFGRLSLHNGQITYLNVIKWLEPYSQELVPSIFQASIGGFYFILGALLGWEWWKYQRKNNLLKVIFFAWLWSVFSEVLLYFTSHWYGMLTQSFDRYIITSSLGAVIFMAGIVVVCLQAAARIKKLHLRLGLFALIGALCILIAWGNFRLLDYFYYDVNENWGVSAKWQDTMYQKFLSQFGEDNLQKSVVLYLDFKSAIKEAGFNEESFVEPARFRLFYNKNGQLIRNNCKSLTVDKDILKDSYVIQNGEEGFLIDSICINPADLSYQKQFYPLSDFYAYKILDREFFDIREEVLKEVRQSAKPAVYTPVKNSTVNSLTMKPNGIFPDSFYYPFKRVWEKFLSLILVFQPQSKVNLEKALLNERLSELNYVAENRLLSKVEESSQRFAYQAGVLTAELIKQNKAQDKYNLTQTFEDDSKLLEKLRDYFPANSSYWLFIQHDINTLKILSGQLK